jgi:histone deacetylase 1/2
VRKYRHIVETCPTLLAHASIPLCYGNDAFATACFLINRLPSCTIDMKTPLQKLINETPDKTFFKVFECACWPHLRPYNNHKLYFCSKTCVFLGYNSLLKGYKCLHVLSNRVYISRDDIFDENVFPLSTCQTLMLYRLSRSLIYCQLTTLWMSHIPCLCSLTMVHVLDAEVTCRF